MKLGKSVKVVVEADAEFPILDVIKEISSNLEDPEMELEMRLKTIVSEWKKIGGNFEKVKEMCASLGAAHNELSTGILRDLKEVKMKASVIDNMILILRDRTGHDAKASEGGTKTVWAAIAEISGTIGDIEVDLKDRPRMAHQELCRPPLRNKRKSPRFFKLIIARQWRTVQDLAELEPTSCEARALG